MKLFHITYDVTAHPEGLTRKQVLSQWDTAGRGATTALVILSCAYPEDGTYSMMVMSKDGRTDKPLPPGEVWKAWAMLTHWLAENQKLLEHERLLCELTFESIREIITGVYRVNHE